MEDLSGRRAVPAFRRRHPQLERQTYYDTKIRNKMPCRMPASAAARGAATPDVAMTMAPLTLRERPSPNHGERGEAPNLRPVDMLVLHYTGMQSAAAALDRLCDPAARVSSHYLVEEDGTVWRLVPEARRAFHAGISYWQGEGDLNRVSIGIEIVNPGHEWGYRPFPEAQMAAVERLCRDILGRHPVPPYRIVGHSDIAPDRKSDPGELFDWLRLARAGIGLWPPLRPEAEAGRGRGVGVVQRTAALADLARIGYAVSADTAEVALAAFQRRFRPARWDGLLDRETCERLSDVRLAVEAAQAAEAARRRARRFN
jgi:N-acetylmuramoyl-L-alanine amidase